ncbi:MAG TPA: terpene cyclase/mutase family protein [Saprospiraceae bacterium]|nr:terpene cyclase/mutase family protein [Saprospiraceae bacterium]HMP24501.1 terpene cyclase/mutase family protein [Saprospiraceae bacterium]
MNNVILEQNDFFAHYIEQLSIAPSIKKALLSAKQGDYDFYAIYPYLFIDPFASYVDASRAKILSTSCFLYFNYLTINDALFDRKDNDLLKNFQVLNFCSEESIKLLCNLFDSDSVFWDLWYKRKSKYAKSLEIERRVEISSEQEYFELADSKSEMGKAALDALYVLSNKVPEKEYNFLLKSYKYFSIASQIVDDIQDFEEDFLNRQQNFILGIAKKDLSLHSIYVNTKNLKSYLYSSDLAYTYYAKAKKYFQKSLRYAAKGGASRWYKVVEKQKLKNDTRVDTLIGFRKVNEYKTKLKQKNLGKIVILPKYSEVKDRTIRDGLISIYKEHNSNYIDLKHLMYLSRSEHFTLKNTILVGEVFQIALVTDILIDLQLSLGVDLRLLINDNIKFIKSKRLKKGIRAWNYFSTINEVAPDIDDLGQILQVLKKTGTNEKYIKQYCLPLIDFAIDNCFDSNYSFYTWLVPKKHLNEIQAKQKQFNTEKWGTGPDTEVVANFIYSLMLIDGITYKYVIESSLNFLISQQHAEGFWASRWYYGNYYGTYVCLRSLLMHSKGNNVDLITKSFQYILNSQNDDGGWGQVSGKSDPLNTAFCIITLKLLDCYNSETSIMKGKNYLIESVNSENKWEAVNFIKPRINDPYRSSTLTTAYVLKALS